MTGLSDSGGASPTNGGSSRAGRAARIILALVVVLGGGGFAYWRFVYYPTTPQYALREFLDAAKNEQYVVAYKRLYVPGPLKLVIPTAESLDSLARTAGGIIPRLDEYRLGKVQATDDRAVIDTVLVTHREGSNTPMSEELQVELLRVDGKWKVDGGWALQELIKRGGKALLESLMPGGSR